MKRLTCYIYLEYIIVPNMPRFIIILPKCVPKIPHTAERCGIAIQGCVYEGKHVTHNFFRRTALHSEVAPTCASEGTIRHPLC